MSDKKNILSLAVYSYQQKWYTMRNYPVILKAANSRDQNLYVHLYSWILNG